VEALAGQHDPPVRRAGIEDVATAAGVSAATVSRALRGMAGVAPTTRARVQEAARDLGYSPSVQAVALASGRTRSIGVVAPFLSRWFFGTVVDAVVEVAGAHGYDVVLHHLGSAQARDRFFDRMPLAGRVDGIVTCSMPLTEAHTLALRALGLPYVGIGPALPGHASVGIDEAAAVASAVRHLVNLGHRRIAYVAGRADDPGFAFPASALRRRGFEEALRTAGLEMRRSWSVAGDYGVEGGIRAMSELLTAPEIPTAVVCEYDDLAFGVLTALRRAGLAVPGDLSVVGIDDHALAPALELTTVHQDVSGQAGLATRLLLAHLAGAAEAGAHVLPTRLVLRGSTAPPPATRPRG
jgi:LacI family transcriptional regulator, repressor for deo operon, udp, cdd, tsx, nupC, and nupG